MYNLEFKCENIFSEIYPYKIHCIGKCQKGTNPLYYDTYYYFISHGKKYEASEIIRGLENINIAVKEVERFELPATNRSLEYFLLKKESQSGNEYDLTQDMKNVAYSKSGFVVFKQLYYKDKDSVLGGIDDIYEYENVNRRTLKKVLNTYK